MGRMCEEGCSDICPVFADSHQSPSATRPEPARSSSDARRTLNSSFRHLGSTARRSLTPAWAPRDAFSFATSAFSFSSAKAASEAIRNFTNSGTFAPSAGPAFRIRYLSAMLPSQQLLRAGAAQVLLRAGIASGALGCEKVKLQSTRKHEVRRRRARFRLEAGARGKDSGKNGCDGGRPWGEKKLASKVPHLAPTGCYGPPGNLAVSDTHTLVARTSPFRATSGVGAPPTLAPEHLRDRRGALHILAKQKPHTHTLAGAAATTATYEPEPKVRACILKPRATNTTLGCCIPAERSRRGVCMSMSSYVFAPSKEGRPC